MGVYVSQRCMNFCPLSERCLMSQVTCNKSLTLFHHQSEVREQWLTLCTVHYNYKQGNCRYHTSPELVPNAMLCIVNGEESPQNCLFPSGFCYPAGGGLNHGHRQHTHRKIGKDRTCGSGDMLADRQTETQMCSSQYFATTPTGKVINHQLITARLTTSLLVILDEAMPKLTMYSTMFFWKTSVGDFIQIVTARPIRRPIGPSGDKTLVPCTTSPAVIYPHVNTHSIGPVHSTHDRYMRHDGRYMGCDDWAAIMTTARKGLESPPCSYEIHNYQGQTYITCYMYPLYGTSVWGTQHFPNIRLPHSPSNHPITTSAGHWGRPGQPSHNVSLRVSISTLLPAPATSSHAIGVGWCHQDSSPRVHLVAFGLLQLPSIWFLWHLDLAFTGWKEDCNTLGRWHSEVPPHHSSLAATTLVTSTTSGF